MELLFRILEQITSYEIDQSGKEFNSVDCINRKITDFKLELQHNLIQIYSFNSLGCRHFI
jgi:hypothetical protein